MRTSQIRRCACSCCGRDATIDKWNKEKEGATCLKCHISETRKAVKQIHEGIKLLYNAVNDENKRKMEAMTSQRKKLLYFQALEAGMIKFEIKAHK